MNKLIGTVAVVGVMVYLFKDKLIDVAKEYVGKKFSITPYSLKVHKLSSNIEFRLGVKIRNESSVNFDISNLNAIVSHIKSGKSTEVAEGKTKTPAFTIPANKTITVDNISIKVPLLTALRIIPNMFLGGQNQFTVRVWGYVEGIRGEATSVFTV